MQSLKVHRVVAALALAIALPSVAAAEIVVRQNWIPGTVGYGDVWTFKCPAGGNFDLTVQNANDGYMGSGGGLDLFALVYDSTGTAIGGGDDEVACLNTPSCAGCPQALAVPCTAGGTYSIQVKSIIRCTDPGTGAGYSLALEVRDSGGNSLPATKVKLGGGPKIKAPALYGPRSVPVIDDSNLP